MPAISMISSEVKGIVTNQDELFFGTYTSTWTRMGWVGKIKEGTIRFKQSCVRFGFLPWRQIHILRLNRYEQKTSFGLVWETFDNLW